MSRDTIESSSVTNSKPTDKEPILDEPAAAIPQDRTSRIRIKNRRKMYLDHHPSYFSSPELELADPLLYDRCVRRFQSASEREAEGRNKGYSGVLEADLYRSEAKLAALSGGHSSRATAAAVSSSSSSSPPCRSYPGADRTIANTTYVRGADGEVLPEDPDEVPRSKEEGLERWQYEMEMRFLRGEDEDFDYSKVDESGEWDVIENREKEEEWFEEEEPGWVDGVSTEDGETGIQDF